MQSMGSQRVGHSLETEQSDSVFDLRSIHLFVRAPIQPPKNFRRGSDKVA